MTPDDILKTEFSEEFVQGMRDRMVASYFKYGALADAFPDKVDALKSLIDRMHLYMDTGNTECMMDVANFAMIEYLRPKHPGAHFRATDSEESPGRKTHRGVSDHRNNDEVGRNYVSPLAGFRDK